MPFANKTPLDDVLKYIKAATTTPTYTGIPIHVDPKGLQDAKVTIASTVEIDQEGMPLPRAFTRCSSRWACRTSSRTGF